MKQMNYQEFKNEAFNKMEKQLEELLAERRVTELETQVAG
jgi:hypothetical protein